MVRFQSDVNVAKESEDHVIHLNVDKPGAKRWLDPPSAGMWLLALTMDSLDTDCATIKVGGSM